MPNKYEREIEEILRNMERTEPKPSFRERLNMRMRGQPRRPEPMRPRPARPSLHLNFSTSEWCFLAGILLGLIAAGFAYVNAQTGNVLTGFLAVLAFVCIIMGIITPWRESRRPLYGRSWYGETSAPKRSLPRPFRFVVTQWKILQLKMRYRRHRGG
ncbi:MAG TPA: hypothetical protein VH599_07870 [Ktedonobacterales bacterium]|jgi:hypothetical protein